MFRDRFRLLPCQKPIGAQQLLQLRILLFMILAGMRVLYELSESLQEDFHQTNCGGHPAFCGTRILLAFLCPKVQKLFDH